ncbi:hypothetical protein H8S90_25635 [Olivibacter sp. SDN3]|uniref:hypothetical protein n=1 Tax=Olivibacter sp. SDN3 TaxID=2764720 RepID=UPI0016513A81|nr:hypothetical protein [Olivibacter sp. SDN3]QNL50024.1 hypothetical protein H8S90_25635 [Olivibacter sp. SDN3]
MKAQIIIAGLLICFSISSAYAQEGDSVQYIQKLEIDKRKKKTFAVKQRDSTMLLTIDTLIMKDRATLEFFGKKKVQLTVKHAEIPEEAYIVGTDSKNNGSDMDIDIRFERLGKLYILAGGRDANNGSRTHPNGNGGNVKVRYDQSGIIPQQENKHKTGYLKIDTRAGGYRVNPQTDLYNIYTQIGMGIRSGAGRLGGVPQGQIYSGSPGRDGKSEIVGY